MVVVQEESPIIVYGAPRSGTTYLNLILNKHPEVFISNETRLFVWVHRSLKVLPQRDQVLLSHREEFLQHLHSRYPQLIRDFYRRLCPDARYWGDKNPHYAALSNFGCLDTIAALFPETHFIHIMRDGRDVVSSLMRKGWADFDLAHKIWTRCVDIGCSFGRRQPRNRYFEVRYEDLIRDDVGVARELFDFLGIEIHPDVVKLCEAQRKERLPLSEPTRDLSSEMTDSNWERTLTLDQRVRSLELLGRHLVRYGYETEASLAKAEYELIERRGWTLVQRIRNVVRTALPPDATVIVVNYGEYGLLNLGGRQGWHFPQVDGGGPERLFATGSEGSARVPWIGNGKKYEFRLYAGTERKTLLDSVRVAGNADVFFMAASSPVKRSEGAFVTASPNPVPAGEGSGETTISWSTGEEGSWGQVYVSVVEGEAGDSPTGSAEAIAQLEKLREKGAEFLLFPSTAFWWLERYEEFVQHLDAHYRRTWSDEHCIIYRLSEPEPDSALSV